MIQYKSRCDFLAVFQSKFFFFAAMMSSIGMGISISNSQADEYFPDLNSQPEFRHEIEKVLVAQKPYFDYIHNGITHHYLVSYGKGYSQTHAVRLIPRNVIEFDKGNSSVFNASISHFDRNNLVDTFGDFLHEKAVYIESETTLDHTKEYQVFIPKKGSSTELSRNSLQGPYFTFELSEIKTDQDTQFKYFMKNGEFKTTLKMKFQEYIRKYALELIASSKEIQETRTMILELSSALMQENSKISPSQDLSLTEWNNLSVILERLIENRHYLLSKEQFEILQYSLPETLTKSALFSVLRFLNLEFDLEQTTLDHIIPEELTFGKNHFLTILTLAKLKRSQLVLMKHLDELYGEVVLPQMTISKIVPYLQRTFEEIPEEILTRAAYEFGLIKAHELKDFLNQSGALTRT